MTDQFDTPKGIEDEIGISSAEVSALGELIIEDEEQALFIDDFDEDDFDDDEATAFDDLPDNNAYNEDTPVYDEKAHEQGEEDKDGNSSEFAGDDQLVQLPDGSETTVHELVRGNLRDADYRHKTMELADQRREFETERNQLVEHAEQTAQTMAQERDWMAQILHHFMPPEPDPALMHHNPQAYEQAVLAYQAHQQNLAQIAQNQHHAEASRTHQMEQMDQEILANEFQAMIADNPDFEDPSEFEAFKDAAIDHFTDYGFAPEEIEGVRDHRFIKVMRDAIAFQELKAATPKAMQKLKDRPPVMGSNPRKGTRTRASKAVKDRIFSASRQGDAASVSDILGHLLEQH